jgi:hypothetical protein
MDPNLERRKVVARGEDLLVPKRLVALSLDTRGERREAQSHDETARCSSSSSRDFPGQQLIRWGTIIDRRYRLCNHRLLADHGAV